MVNLRHRGRGNLYISSQDSSPTRCLNFSIVQSDNEAQEKGIVAMRGTKVYMWPKN